MSEPLVGSKCPCLCWYPSGGVLEAVELADPACELCSGSGYVGRTMDEIQEEEQAYAVE